MERNEMYNAFVERDPGFEGRFFAAVRTTGIFCRPTCRARKPKEENVEFFETTSDAICAGYRPCKLCNPLDYQAQIPGMIREVLEMIETQSQMRLHDSDLKKRGLAPHFIRIWFKKNYGLTFHGYLRAIRLGRAFIGIRNGE
jgi:AraC family transcriptional regulator, regulatory protein of adaptative response / methylated-DNA-[protein]-cysteine methyltransferase